MIWRIFTFTGLSLTAGVLGYWAADRVPPTDIISHRIITPKVRPGEDFKIQYTAYRRVSCHSEFQRVYRDGDGTRFTEPPVNILVSPAPLGHDEYITATPISVKAAPGNASFRAITIYICNPIHKIWPIIQIMPIIEFEIAGEPIGSSIEIVPRR